MKTRNQDCAVNSEKLAELLTLIADWRIEFTIQSIIGEEVRTTHISEFANRR